MILFVSLFQVVVKGGGVEQIACVTKEDCYAKLPDARQVKVILRTKLRSNIEVFVHEDRFKNYSVWSIIAYV
ncbi:hypothetical protein P8452_59902 [Trifolium repens]|nr:hypothetical protein P8452_59902 [Trifolium repens]